LDTVDFFGLSLLSGSLDEVADDLSGAWHATEPRVICHINANNFEQIAQHAWLIPTLRAGGTMFVDGIGVKCALAFLRRRWVPDINGTDLFPMVMTRLSGTGISLFLLGGSEHVVERTAAMIARRWDIPVAGFRDGYFAESEEREICQSINDSGAQVLIVARGCPIQEEFALRNRSLLKVRLIWTVGGLFDFIAGEHQRAPLPMRKIRMEWLFRWLVEPRAKAHRTWILYPKFAARVLRERIHMRRDHIDAFARLR
jgi:N-acetylglucosaminyldiphosphoundecaprenol N-acetyl-beta-D-mannosaminyltransferase